jgi:hypothetical protein
MSTEISFAYNPIDYYKITVLSHDSDDITAAKQLRKAMNVSHKTALDMVKTMPCSFHATQFEIENVAKNFREHGFEISYELDSNFEKFN